MLRVLRLCSVVLQFEVSKKFLLLSLYAKPPQNSFKWEPFIRAQLLTCGRIGLSWVILLLISVGLTPLSLISYPLGHSLVDSVEPQLGWPICSLHVISFSSRLTQAWLHGGGILCQGGFSMIKLELDNGVLDIYLWPASVRRSICVEREKINCETAPANPYSCPSGSSAVCSDCQKGFISGNTNLWGQLWGNW